MRGGRGLSRLVMIAALAAAAPVAHAGVILAAGPGFFARDGQDLYLGWQADGARWRIGLRHVAWTDEFHDPYTGNLLTLTDTAITGVQGDWLFHPERPRSWYLGLSLARDAKRDTSMMTGEVGTDSQVAPFFGGGYGGAFASHGYFLLGMYIAPGVTVRTETSASIEEDQGLFDVQALVGLKF